MHLRSLTSIFVFCCFDSIIPLLAISKISRLYQVPAAEQTGLSHTWSDTSKDSFIVTWLNYAKASLIKKIKYSSVFRENRCPPPHKPVYGGKFSHEAVTLKIRSRSPKSNKLLILSALYRLANLVIFHPMVHEITCRQTLFG